MGDIRNYFNSNITDHIHLQDKTLNHLLQGIFAFKAKKAFLALSARFETEALNFPLK
jgi:hypothetical protein